MHLIKGDDEVLVGQGVGDLVTELLRGGDRSLMLEELGEAQYTTDGDPDLTPLITAAQTPPFLTDRRIVVGRHLGLFTRAEQVAALVAWLQQPTETTDLVLVWERGSSSTRAAPARRWCLPTRSLVKDTTSTASATATGPRL